MEGGMSKPQRWFLLIHELEVRPGQTGSQLAKRFGCSKRTIMRDIRHLEEQLAVVIINDNGYRFYSKPFFPPLAFQWDEVVAILFAHNLALPQLDPQTSQALSRAVDKMRRGMAKGSQRIAKDVEKYTAVIPSAATETDTSATLFMDLTRATQERLTISFLYQGRDDEDPQLRQVEPLGISFQSNRWYLHAYDLVRNGQRTFRLGRISELRVSETHFVPKVEFEASRAAFHQWDLSVGEPVEFTLKVSTGLARWFEENKPHPSVHVDGSIVTVKVKDPEAFLRWFCSLDDAELVSPPKWRTWLRERCGLLAQSYQSDAPHLVDVHPRSAYPLVVD